MSTFKDDKKNTLIKWLMLFSMILLMGFVSYWIYGQYQKVKDQLFVKLKSDYFTSQNQALDSLIMFQFLDPVLKDNLNHNVNIFKTHESNAFIDKTDTLNDSVRVFTSTKGDLIMRSLKIIVNSSDKIFPTDSINKFHYSIPIDSNLFKQIFTYRIQKDGMRFDMKWISDNTEDSFQLAKQGIFIDAGFHYNLPGVLLSKYTLYIVKLIFPQILFAILLVCLSAFAFYFAFKSLKKQILLNTLRNDFVSNITHELKTPISTVMVALEAIKTYDLNKDTEKVTEYVDMITDEMKRLDGLISKIMDHSVLEGKNEVLKKENTDLVNLVNELISKVKLQFPEININFNSVNKSTQVYIDHLYVNGVIYNLIDNSIKYASTDATANPIIELHLEEDQTYYILSVNDNGKGIPDEYIPKLFDKFFRVPMGNKHNIKGYGLGLSYANLVMNQHGGSISYKNILKGGNSFILKFPKSI